MDLEFLKQYVPTLLVGAGMTLKLTIITLLIGTILGLCGALFKNSKLKVLNLIAGFYTWIIRGTPTILQLFIIYFGIPGIFPELNLSPFVAAIIGLSINCGAYMTEIIRGGIQSIDKGQYEAAKTLGLSYGQTMKSIVMPQTIRNIMPSVGNEYITMVKETAIVSTISLSELMRQAQIIGSSTFRYFDALIVAGVIYLIITTVMTWIFSIIEKKLSVY